MDSFDVANCPWMGMWNVVLDDCVNPPSRSDIMRNSTTISPYEFTPRDFRKNVNEGRNLKTTPIARGIPETPQQRFRQSEGGNRATPNPLQSSCIKIGRCTMDFDRKEMFYDFEHKMPEFKMKPQAYKISETAGSHRIDTTNIWKVPEFTTKLQPFPFKVSEAAGSQRTDTTDTWKMCGFCKTNGEAKEFFTSHLLKSPNGTVLCPVLRSYKCPFCGATGDFAHTMAYCPITREKNGGVRPIPVCLLLKSSKIKSNGQKRY